MKITICDVCGKLFDEKPSSKCTIGYTDYELCNECQSKIEESMITKTNCYSDRLGNKLLELAQGVKFHKKLEEERQKDS